MGRVVSRDEAERLRREAREQEKTVVFTNGCFDVLHRGHADLLSRARREGDLLVVGVNSDASVRRLKGSERPWVPEDDRAALLAALAAVDLVVLFDEDTPLELIRRLLPDVLVKGADYRREDVVGGDEVEAAGGRVALVPLTPGRSTSRLLERLSRGSEGAGSA
jgi:D-beta-D-heptose 7-phosphate kinase/D-beta-D-heptose 1-phosphate adenosyltransferase